jgi:glycosyltransferase involved in cell wall biosynthesis
LKKTKICHVCDRITGESDGVFTHLMMLFNIIDRNKYDQILIYQGGEIVEKKLRQLGIKYYCVPKLTKRLSFTCFIRLYTILKNENVDIIQSHLIKPYILSGILNMLLKMKLIFNYHGLFIASEYHNQIEKFILQLLHLVIVYSRSVQLAITPSESSKRIMESETKIFPKVEVYYNGFMPSNQIELNSSLVEELTDIKSKYFIVGIVARIETEKRIDYALTILKDMLSSGQSVFFVFFGDGHLIQKMKILSEQLVVHNNCKFFGYVSDAPIYFKYFDTILSTSDREGLPLTYWEAMANSVPIVSTDVGGAKEILIENNCGLIFQKGNLEAGKLAIQRLIEDKAFRISLGQNGTRVINQKYNMVFFKKYFEELYSNLVK